jgi:hypothetical protein
MVLSMLTAVCLIFLSLLINSARSELSNNLLTYSNNYLKFTIQHPSNWMVVEDKKSHHQTVWFKISSRTMPIFVVQIHHFESSNDTAIMSLNNTILEYVRERQDLLSSLDIDYNPIKQNYVTVDGNLGVKVEFTVGNFFNSDIFTIVNGKLYELSYHDDTQTVPQNVKLASDMFNSFRVFK